jgi:hypothetical protein
MRWPSRASKQRPAISKDHDNPQKDPLQTKPNPTPPHPQTQTNLFSCSSLLTQPKHLDITQQYTTETNNRPRKKFF